MADINLAFSSASQLRDLVAAGKVSPVELTELYLRRIQDLDPRLNSYITVAGEEAMASAREAEEAVVKGQPLGPLHGVPISVKDLELTNGVRTTLGSLFFKDTVPDQDSLVVERIRQSGAIILGKTNTPEFGVSGSTENRLGDACRNPWNPERTSGGSSGGAGASLAAGLCALASGTDAGGSVRIPASFCGVYGIKPTQGRVPRYGGYGRPTVNQLGQTGPMSRSVRDSAILLQALAGPDQRDHGSLQENPPDFLATLGQGVKGLSIGWSSDLGYAAVDPEVLSIASQAAKVFSELGASVDEAGLSLEDPLEHFLTIFRANSFASYGHLYRGDPDKMTDYALLNYDHASRLTASDYASALWHVGQLQRHVNDCMVRFDLLLTPTMAVTAFPVGQRPEVIAGKPVDPLWGFLPFTFPINLAGLPAASIPCGFSSDGMPVGLHIIGRWGDEATVLRASAAFEQARPWADKRPQIS